MVYRSLVNPIGKLSPTSSHLFKLILPLGSLTSRTPSTRPAPSSSSQSKSQIPPPTVFLLHPSQPLTHVARLILSSFAPAQPRVTFRSVSPSGQTLEWSESTDVGDFIRDAARATEFMIHIMPEQGQGIPEEETVITVEVPTFADRTRFLRWRLQVVEGELKEMESLKTMCDRLAHKGARRMALTGFGILVAYWGTVARLTFWDYGWYVFLPFCDGMILDIDDCGGWCFIYRDVMEPITYLSGLSTVICGYLWFVLFSSPPSLPTLPTSHAPLPHTFTFQVPLPRPRGILLLRPRPFRPRPSSSLVQDARTRYREMGRTAGGCEEVEERDWRYCARL